MKTAINTVALALLSLQTLWAQVNERLPLHKPQTTAIGELNAVSFNIPSAELNQLYESKGKKLALKLSEITVNDDTVAIEHIHVRGQTSSYFRRKSFNIKTSKKSAFHNGADSFALTKFYAISMNMDRNYIRNKISYAVLNLVGVRTPTNCYSNLVINGHSEGLYLIFYPPDEYAIKQCHSPLVIRRGYDESMEKISTSKEMDRERAKELKKKFRSIYAPATLNKSGEELFQLISSVLDLKSYYSWLAFNHLFQNGDYADEAYFMWNPEKSRFEVIPWDFDDLLKGHPHEGAEERGKSENDKLIFSLEDALDKKIASDPYLYKKYLEVYKDLLDTLTSKKLASVLMEVFDDVYPYFNQEDIIAQSQFDQYGQTDLSKLEADLNSIYQYISIKSTELHKDIAPALR